MSKLNEAVNKNQLHNTIQDGEIRGVQKDVEYLKTNQDRIEKSHNTLHDKVDKIELNLTEITTVTKNVDSNVSGFINDYKDDGPKIAKFIKWVISLFLIISTIGISYVIYINNDRINFQEKYYQLKIKLFKEKIDENGQKK